MSHVETVNVVITDLKALDAACARLGVALVKDKTTYNWFGVSVGDYPVPAGFKAADLGKCEHAIQVPGAHYEIGVVPARNPDGTVAKGYTLLYDFYGSGGRHDGQKLQKKFGTGLTKLVDAYSVEALKAKARASGYLTREVARADGKIELRVSVP
jgi:ribosomal protein S17E